MPRITAKLRGRDDAAPVGCPWNAPHGGCGANSGESAKEHPESHWPRGSSMQGLSSSSTKQTPPLGGPQQAGPRTTPKGTLDKRGLLPTNWPAGRGGGGGGGSSGGPQHPLLLRAWLARPRFPDQQGLPMHGKGFAGQNSLGGEDPFCHLANPGSCFQLTHMAGPSRSEWPLTSPST